MCAKNRHTDASGERCARARTAAGASELSFAAPSGFRVGAAAIDPPVALAPMAGVTDAGLRAQVRRFGAGLVVSEMVSARAYLTGKSDVLAKAALQTDDLGTAASVQIAARDPVEIAEAARRAADDGAPIIDINMGCPAKKVTSGAAGAALMREPELARRLIEAARAAVDVPVTVKMRLGWDDDSLTAPQIAADAEAAGAAMIVVHARTRAQFYKGAADWSRARATRSATRSPMLINGDVIDGPSAVQALQASGADGVMVGRAAAGRPWLLAEIACALSGRPFATPLPAERVALAMEHYEGMLERYGIDVGVRAARKHLAWRLEAFGLPLGVATSTRAALMRAERPAETLEILRRLLADDREDAAVASADGARSVDGGAGKGAMAA